MLNAHRICSVHTSLLTRSSGHLSCPAAVGVLLQQWRPYEHNEISCKLGSIGIASRLNTEWPFRCLFHILTASCGTNWAPCHYSFAFWNLLCSLKLKKWLNCNLIIYLSCHHCHCSASMSFCFAQSKFLWVDEMVQRPWYNLESCHRVSQELFAPTFGSFFTAEGTGFEVGRVAYVPLISRVLTYFD